MKKLIKSQSTLSLIGGMIGALVGVAFLISLSYVIAAPTDLPPLGNPAFPLEGPAGPEGPQGPAGIPDPDYDSGWFYVTNTSGKVSKAHGLGKLPAVYSLYSCGNVSGDSCLTESVLSERGYQEGGPFGANLNPINSTADSNYIHIYFISSWWVWGYWHNTLGFNCSGDADGNCNTGYYRIKAWR